MPFDSLKFRYPWRPYQERVLSAVEKHLDDGRIHLVAAPGAGKTTLGLEIFRILQKPTLVLSPTRVIRDQWIGRLKDFCEIDEPKDLEWVSNSIKTPGILTSITYQALHASFSDELKTDKDDEESVMLEDDKGLDQKEINDFLQALDKNGVEVLILDEAHHLKAEWWRALDQVCQHFPNLTLVSLTATPPYDSKEHEWSRYEALCGPIDEEISVPELVKAGTLCAHQDFFWACNATESEELQIAEYDERVSVFCKSLFENEDFESVVRSHPWLHREDVAAEVIRDPKIALSILSFLKSKNLESGELLMTTLDLTPDDIPELGRVWWQVLVESVLFSPSFELTEENDEFVSDLRKQLRASGLLYRRELSLERSRRLERSLSLSSAKINACVLIHNHEFDIRGDSLRQVILTDFIRDEESTSKIDTGGISLGAWPVFAAVASESPIPADLGLLTGRLSIIHKSKIEILQNHLDPKRTSTKPIDSNEDYVRVLAPLNQLIRAFTALLMKGEIKTLVGTRALLGEGWDAPAVNSMILASSVGSFMLTNQMRGRAIRIDPDDKDKVSSIWHLAAVNMKSYSGVSDFNNLQRRFNTFVGLSEKNLTIKSGFERINADAFLRSLATSDLAGTAKNNREMKERSASFDAIRTRWKEALILEKSARVVPSVEVVRAPRLRGHVLKYSFQYALIKILAALSSVASFALGTLLSTNPNFRLALYILAVGMFGAFIYKLPYTISILKTIFRFLPVDGGLRQIGKALADALSKAGFVETPSELLDVNVSELDDGSYYLSLQGASFYESSLFADCVDEILSPIDSPRYVVIRKGNFLGQDREDYHAVPLRFGVKKELAEIFQRSWDEYVSPTDLVYTRTDQGRELLLRAKMKSFSSTSEKNIKRLDRWQ